jgi:hypothetical protein
MEHADSELDDTIVVERTEDADLDRTIVRPRRRARAAAEPLTTDAIADAIADADADAVDETVDETIVVDRSDSGDEQTIVVDRRPRLLGIEDDDDDDTDRSATRPPLEAEDDTDRTVARPRDDDADADETITVDRAAPSVKLPPVPSLRPARVQRRRGIAPPPVPVGFAPAARAAVGPGAVDHYRRRELAVPPAVRAAPDGGIVSTRVIDPDLPSVARRARRTAVVALAAFVGACIVSVTGLTLILLWVF